MGDYGFLGIPGDVVVDGQKMGSYFKYRIEFKMVKLYSNIRTVRY